MARLIEITRPGSDESGFLVSGVKFKDGSLKNYYAFNKAKILALHEIFQQIIKEKTCEKLA